MKESNGAYIIEKCCRTTRDCWDPTNETSGRRSLRDFFYKIVRGEGNNIVSTDGYYGRSTSECVDRHWMPYSNWIEPKFWKVMNFVGHMDPPHDDNSQSELQRDAKALLERIGAWDKYGASGWGLNGTSSFLDPSDTRGRVHVTDAYDAFYRYYHPWNQQLFDDITNYYDEDYSHPLMDLHVRNLTDLAIRRRRRRRQLRR